MGTYSSARGAIEAIGGSTNCDQHSPNACGEKGVMPLGISGPETAAPGAGPGVGSAKLRDERGAHSAEFALGMPGARVAPFRCTAGLGVSPLTAA